jgi:hypothetical protein
MRAPDALLQKALEVKLFMQLRFVPLCRAGQMPRARPLTDDASLSL